MSATQHTGLIGWPVAHSLSPVIHGHWRKKYNITGNYELLAIDPASMDPAIKKLKASGLRGVNVTVPHKESIIPYLDSIDTTAHQIGAVNTLVREGQTWRGTNTDAYGFITHLKEQLGDLTPYLQKAVILGAGGAARAAISALKAAGFQQLTITNRTRASADILAAEFGVKSAPWEARDEILDGTGLLVNTTSLGMKGKEPLIISLSKLSSESAVYDIVYSPLETPLLAAARRHGLRVVDGLGMLLYQAQRAFEEWHGVLPQVDETLRLTVLEEIRKREYA